MLLENKMVKKKLKSIDLKFNKLLQDVGDVAW